MKSRRYLMGVLFVGLATLAAACSGPSRPASTPVDVPGGPDQQATDPVAPQPTDAASQVETLMAGDLVTQTAMAAGGDQTPEPPPEATAEPQPTDAPQQDPTPVPPTKEPEPTAKPKVDCSSPYTVKKGDWVWDIGRRCNIHPNAIIAANGLVYPYLIYPGNVLVLPSNAPPFPGP